MREKPYFRPTNIRTLPLLVRQASLAFMVFDQPPGKESDPEIKGAVMGQESLSPVRWTNANTLILERHDYYEKLTPSSGDIHTLGHFYKITVSFKDDGTANTSWKLRSD